MTTPTSPAPRARRRVLLASCLIGGTILSLGLMVATRWVPFLDWVAVVVALTAGFLATWAALVEFREWRIQALAADTEARAVERARTQQLHATQRGVLTTVEARVQAIAGALGEARSELDATKEELVGTKVALGESQHHVSRLRGDNEALRVENAGLRTENTGLRTELAAATAGADVVALPRRRVTDAASEWEVLDAPTVVDLDLQRLAQPFVAEVQARHAN